MDVDVEKLAALCDRLGIRRLSVLGSVARGEERPESDIDLLAEFSERASLLDLVQAERELAEELGRRVDLLTPAALSPHLRDRIQNESRVLYERADNANEQLRRPTRRARGHSDAAPPLLPHSPSDATRTASSMAHAALV